MHTVALTAQTSAFATRGFSFTAVLARLGAALETARQRRALANLDAHVLADLGLTRAEAESEAAKPFWA